jgi:hypothetical protein
MYDRKVIRYPARVQIKYTESYTSCNIVFRLFLFIHTPLVCISELHHYYAATVSIESLIKTPDPTSQRYTVPCIRGQQF